jgi:hypothetical protein
MVNNLEQAIRCRKMQGSEAKSNIMGNLWATFCIHKINTNLRCPASLNPVVVVSLALKLARPIQGC